MSIYRPSVELVSGRPLWRVVRKGNKLTGIGDTVVWSGISKASCRRALCEFREWERYNTTNYPNVARTWKINPN